MNIKIGGFQKNTLIDFPGVVASLVFTQGCNFRCPYCHNPSLIPFPLSKSFESFNLPIKSLTTSKINNLFAPSTLIDESEIFSFLKKRKGLIDGVAITGGEPTLQPALESFCFRLKNMGFKVKIDTNGSRPDVIENLIKRELVDFIAMDIKSNRAGYTAIVSTITKFDSTITKFDFSQILKSIKLIIKKAPAYEFRTTCVKPFISREIIVEIGEMIKGASHYVIQHCSQNIQMLNFDFFKKNNQNLEPFFSEPDLIELKLIIESYVQECSIR